MVVTFIKDFLKNKERNYVLIAQVISTVFALVTGKLIAIYILPEDFGAYSLQWAAFTFFSTLCVSPLIQFIKATSGSLLPKIGSRPYILTFIVSLLIAYVLTVLFLLYYYTILDVLLSIILFVFLVFWAFYQILANYLNTENKLIIFSKLGIFKALGEVSFVTLFFVLGFSFLDHLEVLWIIQLTGVLIASVLFVSNYRVFKAKFKIAYSTFLRKYFRFAGPLMFMAIWAWINNYFDRYAIEYYLTYDHVGNYNAGYSVGSKIFLVLIPIFWTLVTPTLFSNKNISVKKKILLKYGLNYALLAIPILIVVYFTKDYIGELLLSENYREGFFLIFWIAMAVFVFTTTQMFELLFYATQQTNIILAGNLFSAIVNIVLNIVLIPRLGIAGAAVATCSGFIVHFGIIYIKFIKM